MMIETWSRSGILSDKGAELLGADAGSIEIGNDEVNMLRAMDRERFIMGRGGKEPYFSTV